MTLRGTGIRGGDGVEEVGAAYKHAQEGQLTF